MAGEASRPVSLELESTLADALGLLRRQGVAGEELLDHRDALVLRSSPARVRRCAGSAMQQRRTPVRYCPFGQAVLPLRLMASTLPGGEDAAALGSGAGDINAIGVGAKEMVTSRPLGRGFPMSPVRTTFTAFGLLIAVACASPASAQYATSGGGRSVELTLFNGYYIASDLYTTIGAAPGAQIGLENSYMWGGRIGIDPNEMLGIEGVYSRFGSDLNVRNGVTGYNPGNIGRIEGNAFDVDFLFYQQTPSPKTKAYFTVGFGWTMTDPQLRQPAVKDLKSNSLFAWNFGAGTKVNMNEKLALRLEGRWRVTDTAITTSSGVYCDYYGYCYSYASDWYNSGELTAGLTYKLGGR
jgi:opacity protein-like surface antigen